MRTVGLCHSVQHTAGELPLDEIRDLVDALLEAHGDRVPPLATGPLQRAG